MQQVKGRSATNGITSLFRDKQSGNPMLQIYVLSPGQNRLSAVAPALTIRVVCLLILPALYSTLLSTAWAADAPKPEIKAHAPLYLRAGHTSTVLVYGENLAPQSVTATKPQVTVKLIGTR